MNMAILKSKSIRGSDANDKLKEIRLELMKELGASETSTVKNPGRVRELKRTVARILTINREKVIQKG